MQQNFSCAESYVIFHGYHKYPLIMTDLLSMPIELAIQINLIQ